MSNRSLLKVDDVTKLILESNRNFDLEKLSSTVDPQFLPSSYLSVSYYATDLFSSLSLSRPDS